MENEILKINILSITISGLLMLVSGAVLYFFLIYGTSDSINWAHEGFLI